MSISWKSSLKFAKVRSGSCAGSARLGPFLKQRRCSRPENLSYVYTIQPSGLNPRDNGTEPSYTTQRAVVEGRAPTLPGSGTRSSCRTWGRPRATNQKQRHAGACIYHDMQMIVPTPRARPPRRTTSPCTPRSRRAPPSPSRPSRCGTGRTASTRRSGTSCRRARALMIRPSTYATESARLLRE